MLFDSLAVPPSYCFPMLENTNVCVFQVIKMYAWEKYFENKVTKIRNDELAYMKKAALLNAAANAACLLTPYLVSKLIMLNAKYLIGGN